MRTAVIALLLAITGTAVAETRYVDDQLVITLRTGQGNAYQIIRNLTTGTAMEILEADDKYSHVRLQDGTEGWVLNQYLTDQPVARDRLVQAEQKLTRLESENQQLKKDLVAIKGEKKAVEGEHKSLSGTTEKLQNELERLKSVAARPVELEKQNTEMRQRLQELELNSRMLQEENTAMRDRTNRDWFLAGAGVLFAGLLLGLILPKLKRRTSGWGEWR